MLLRVLPFLMSAVLLASCAGTKEFTVRTTPEGADVCINGKEVGKTPLTLEVEQTKSLGIVAHKDGYELGTATIPTKSHWFYALLWTSNDPKAQVIEQNEVTIPLRKIASAADYVPTPLPAFAPPSSSFPLKPEEVPSLRPMPEL